MDGYGQFCPVAMASEVLTTRWTPLIVRELLCGSRRFNDLHRGVPKISRTLLSRRLRELEHAGVLERRTVDGHPEYHPTPACQELWPVIEALGAWGKRWGGVAAPEELDVRLLLWDMQRRIDRERLPLERVVVHLSFPDELPADRDFWLMLEREEVDVCFEDPGMECQLQVETDVRTLTDVWMGDRTLAEALRCEELRLRGRGELRREFPTWLGLNFFAGRDRMVRHHRGRPD